MPEQKGILVVARTPISHHGTVHAPGAAFALAEEAAQVLIAAGEAEPAPPTPTKGEKK